MPFEKGWSGGPGRAKHSIRELTRNHPMRDKRKLVAMAFKFAIAGDVRWAEWILRASGELLETDGSDHLTVSQSVSGTPAELAELTRLLAAGRDAARNIVIEPRALAGSEQADDSASD